MAAESLAAPLAVHGAPRTWRLSPTVIALAAATAVAAPLRLGVTPHAIIAAGALAVLVVLAAIDMQARILPNRILGPATAVVLAAQIAFFPERALEWVLAMVGAAAIAFTPALVNPAAIGMGDVKLAGFLGALLGAQVLPALMWGFLATGPVLAVLLVRHGSDARRTPLPLGPFLALGAAIVLLV